MERMDHVTTPPVHVPVPTSSLQQGQQQQTQNIDLAVPVDDGVLGTTSFNQQPQGIQNNIPSLESVDPCTCTFSCVRLSLIGMVVVDILVQGFLTYYFAFPESNPLTGLKEYIALSIHILYAGEVFFMVLTLVASIVEFISCLFTELKWLCVKSHVVGWISILISILLASIYIDAIESKIYRQGAAIIILISVTVGLTWRIFESIAVYKYWVEIPNQGQYVQGIWNSQNQGNTSNIFASSSGVYPYAYGNTSSAVPLNYGYSQSTTTGGYGGYAQPGYYSGQGVIS